MTLADKITLAKYALIAVVGIYVYKRGPLGIVADVAGAAGRVVYENVLPPVRIATEDSALNVTGAIKSIQTNTGMNEDQARTIELLALGNMGA